MRTYVPTAIHPETILRDAVRLRNELFSARPEVFIATELLADGAADVFGVLLHEAAHAIAAARDIKDTSRQGRYHNAASNSSPRK